MSPGAPATKLAAIHDAGHRPTINNDRNGNRNASA
jgi:hypothetical protein